MLRDQIEPKSKDTRRKNNIKPSFFKTHYNLFPIKKRCMIRSLKLNNQQTQIKQIHTNKLK